jgi:hypothetical protein
MSQDVISQAMENFAGTLTYIAQLKESGRSDDVPKIIGVNLNRLLRVSPKEFCKLTETGLLAQLLRNGSATWVPYKIIMLIRLLKELGDYATMEDPLRGGYGWYLKSLHLLLDALYHDEVCGFSRFLPEVEDLLLALGDVPLPVRTRLLLIREYERRGSFGRVWYQFQAALGKAPDNPRLIKFGIALLERLSRHSDAALAEAGFTRAQISVALAQLATAKSAWPLVSDDGDAQDGREGQER